MATMGVFNKGGKCMLGMPDGSVCELSGKIEELHVEVVEARDLPVMDVGADVTEEEREAGIGISCDAFCRLSVGDTERRTKVVNDSLDPVWSEDFLFVITDPRDERGEIYRRLTDMTHLKLQVLDWDADGSEDFVGKVEIPISDLHVTDALQRSVFVDGWYELLKEDGSRPRPKQNGNPGKGSVHLRCAMRTGIQVEQLNRLRGADWINPAKFVEALESLPSHFCPGDELVIQTVCWLINHRDEKVQSLHKQHLEMMCERGVPLGLSLHKGPPIQSSGTPVGVILGDMLKNKVPLEATFHKDPRDVHFHTMMTHWPARLAAVKAIGSFVTKQGKGRRMALDAVMSLLDDEAAVVRVAAIQITSMLCDKSEDKVVKFLTGALTDEHRAVRKAAVGALGQVCEKDTPDVVMDICAILEDPRDIMRACAKRALHAVVTKGSTLAIVEVCARLESPISSVRLAAMACLPVVANKGDRICIAEVANRMHHPAQPVRMTALEALPVVSEKGDMFALAVVSNMLVHPDWEVRQVASAGVVVLAKKTDIAAIQSVVRHLCLHSECESVVEAARYVSMPTAKRDTNWSDPQLQSRHASTVRYQMASACDIYTPRAEHFLPVLRRVNVAVHVPLIPSDPRARSIVHSWWKDKHANDSVRHRYNWEETGFLPCDQYDVSMLASAETTVVQPLLAHWPGTDRGLLPIEELRSFESKDQMHPPADRVSTSASKSSKQTSLHSRHAKRESWEQSFANHLRRSRELVLDVLQDLLYDSKQSVHPTWRAIIDALQRVVSAQDDLKEWRWELTFPPDVEEKDFSVIKLMLQHNHHVRSGLERAAGLIATSLGKTVVKSTDFLPPSSAPSGVHASGGGTSQGKEEEITMTLTLFVEGATHLPLPSSDCLIDPFVTLEVLGARSPVRTQIKINSQHPKWDENFSIPLSETMLRIAARRPDTGSDDPDDDPVEFTPITPRGTGASVIGLFYDTLLTLPLTKSEMVDGQIHIFSRAITEAASQKNADCVQVLKQSQIGPRTREVLVRVFTRDLIETLTMGDRLTGQSIGIKLQEKHLIDEHRVDLVHAEAVTTPESLSALSLPLVCNIWHFQLSLEPVFIGAVTLPLGPLVNTIQAHDGDVFSHSFPVRDRFGNLIRSEEHQCELQMAFCINQALQKAPISHRKAQEREKRYMADALRSIAADTLHSICIGEGAVEIAIAELLNCFRSTSGDVHQAVVQAIRRLAPQSHSAGLTGVTWWGEGLNERVVTCSEDSTLKLWRADDGFLEDTFRGHETFGLGSGVRAVDSRGGRLVSGGADGTVRLWDIVSREERALLPEAAPTAVNCVALSIDGRLLFAGGGGGSRKLGWNEGAQEESCIHVWRLISMMERDSAASNLGCHGDRLDGTLKEEHIRLAEVLAGCYYRSHTEPPFKIVMPLIERIVLWGGSSKLAASKLPGELPLAAKELARASMLKYLKEREHNEHPLDYPPWMRTLVLRIRREGRNLKCLHAVKISHGLSMRDFQPTCLPSDAVLCIVPDPHNVLSFASSGEDGVIRVWEISDDGLQPVQRQRLPEGQDKVQVACVIRELREHSSRVTAVAYHPQCQGILVSASRSVLIWDLHNSHRIAALAPPLGESTLCSMCLSSKGTMIAVGSGQGRMKVWDLRIYDHTSRGVAFRKVVSSSPREPSFVHRGEVTGMAFNQSGTLCATASLDKTSLLFDPRTCKAIRVLSGDPLPMGIRHGICAGALVNGLEHLDAQVRRCSKLLLSSVAEWGDPGLIIQVCTKMGNKNRYVRDSALDVLNDIAGENGTGGIEALKIVLRLLLHTDSEVRQDAQKGLHILLQGDPEKIGRMIHIANKIVASKNSTVDTFLSVAAEALLSLGGVGGMPEDRLVSSLRRWDMEKEWGGRLVKLEGFVNVGVALQAKDGRQLAALVTHADLDVREIAGEAAAVLVGSQEQVDGVASLVVMIPSCTSGLAHLMHDAHKAVGLVISSLLLKQMDKYVDWEKVEHRSSF